MSKPPIRSNSKKKCILPIKIPENSNSLSSIHHISFEESSPSTLQNNESPQFKLPKIPNSANLPIFFQHLNEKFAEKTSSVQQIMESFESYCNRAIMMTSQKEVINSGDYERTQIKELIRQQNKKLASMENFGVQNNKK